MIFTGIFTRLQICSQNDIIGDRIIVIIYSFASK